MVLSCDFLDQTNAFTEYENAFWHVEDRDDDNAWMLSLIQLLREAINGTKGGRSCECGAASLSNQNVHKLLKSCSDEAGRSEHSPGAFATDARRST